MNRFLKRLDQLAGIDGENRTIAWLDRLAFVFLILMVVSAPHSIAATQTAWLIGMLAFIVRLFIKPRPKYRFTKLDYALWAFFGWSVISSIASYAPDISLDRLRGVSLFLIVYFVIYNVRKLGAVYLLAFALIFSCMVNVFWTPIQRIIGRGIEIHGLKPESPLSKALLYEGDALLEANGKKLKTPDDLVTQIEQNETTKVKFYRPDFEFVVDINRADLLAGDSADQKLGIESWTKSHNWRSQGFYGHYTTYAEVLQLIASLVFGLVVASSRKQPAETQRRRDEEGNKSMSSPSSAPHLAFSLSFLLIISLAGMCLALLLTVTRASQLAFLISAFSIVLLGASRKWLIAGIVIVLPIIFASLLFLQQSRQVGFFDSGDESIKYRETMWRDGVRLAATSPRNLAFGVGMDSVQRYWREWGLYDGGRLPMGHFHSTPMQLLVERGLPALLLWLTVLAIYARTLWRRIRREKEKRRKGEGEKWSFGILLGCMGGMIGFFASGLVHYNLGDQEVAMVFYLLMGLGVRSAQISGDPGLLSAQEMALHSKYRTAA